MNAHENKPAGSPLSLNYWRLWLANTALVTGALLFFLAAQYGTCEYFGTACLMALLPLIPILVLVGGGGSTVFILTKVRILDKRPMTKSAALALLLGPGLLISLVLVLLGVAKTPSTRLAYICHGNPPVNASHVHAAGYSAFLREEWLAVFNVGPRDFQSMVTKAELVPTDIFEFKHMLDKSSLKTTVLFQSVPWSDGLQCFGRTFKPGEEHERGSIHAAFDPATSTALVFRECHD